MNLLANRVPRPKVHPDLENAYAAEAISFQDKGFVIAEGRSGSRATYNVSSDVYTHGPRWHALNQLGMDAHQVAVSMLASCGGAPLTSMFGCRQKGRPEKWLWFPCRNFVRVDPLSEGSEAVQELMGYEAPKSLNLSRLLRIEMARSRGDFYKRISKKSGVDKRTIKRIVDGKSDPRLSTVQKIMDAIDQSLTSGGVAKPDALPWSRQNYNKVISEEMAKLMERPPSNFEVRFYGSHDLTI